jgi:hypothetical protein
MSQRVSHKELAEYLNEYMAERMFLVSTNITAADIVVFTALAGYFAVELKDYEKLALPHVFRWLDHIQHLPGLLQQVQAKNLFVPFPDESAEPPSKAQLKKLAKAQAAKEAKEQKKAGGDDKNKAPQEKKPQQKQQETAKEETKQVEKSAEKTEKKPEETKEPKQKQQQN